MAALDFEAGLDAYVAAHQKQWKHDRTKSVGASESYGCLRKSWFGKHGTPKDPDYKDSWGAMERGNIIEDHFIVPRLAWILGQQAPKAKFLYAGQSNQRTLINEEAQLSVTPDGLVMGVDDDALAKYGIASLQGSGCFLTEFKSIDPRVNLKEEKSQHHGQVQIQLGMIREQTRFKPLFALIFYVDASFFDDIEIFIVPFNERAYAAAKERAKLVFETKNVTDLLPEGKIDGTCGYCPFKQACAVASNEATPKDGMRNQDDLPLELQEEFLTLITSERALNTEEKGIKDARADASERLKAFIRETGVKRLQVGDFKATLSWTKGRKSYDFEAMKLDGIDIDKYAKEGSGYDTLRITEKGAKVASDD